MPLGLYVHVPWCTRRCGYCAFTTYVVTDPDELAAAQRTFVDAAVREMAGAATALAAAPALTSVFVGGGTPTLLDPRLAGELLGAVRDLLPVADDLEVTVEANPDGATTEVLAAWRAAGATRVSFGMQSAVPRVLDLLDRTHRPEAVPAAVAAARAAGFDHVGVDLIYGTPGERVTDWAATLEAAVALGTDHVSAYALGVEPGTKLAARVRDGSLPTPVDDEAADRYLAAEERLGRAGFEWYEVSNWATSPDARCRHNLLYWRNHHWWGVGPGAHSHVAGVRWSNHRDPAAWAAATVPGAGGPVAALSDRVAQVEVLDGPARALERVLLGVRVAEGLAVDDLDAAAVAEVVDDGLAEVDAGRLVLTVRGRLLADTVVRALVVGGTGRPEGGPGSV